MTGRNFLEDNYLILPGTVSAEPRTAEEIVKADDTLSDRPYDHHAREYRPAVDEVEEAWEVLARNNIW